MLEVQQHFRVEEVFFFLKTDRIQERMGGREELIQSLLDAAGLGLVIRFENADCGAVLFKGFIEIGIEARFEGLRRLLLTEGAYTFRAAVEGTPGLYPVAIA